MNVVNDERYTSPAWWQRNNDRFVAAMRREHPEHDYSGSIEQLTPAADLDPIPSEIARVAARVSLDDNRAKDGSLCPIPRYRPKFGWRDDSARHYLARLLDDAVVVSGFDRDYIVDGPKWKVIQPIRRAYCYVAREAGYSWSRIGREIRRDHTTVLHLARVARGDIVRGDPTCLTTSHIAALQSMGRERLG